MFDLSEVRTGDEYTVSASATVPFQIEAVWGGGPRAVVADATGGVHSLSFSLQLPYEGMYNAVEHFVVDLSALHLLFEFCPGGELLRLLQQSDRGVLDGAAAAFYAAGLALALEYLHDRSIAHRDLKPENVLIDARGYPKLAGFEFAKEVTGATYTLCGTPEYLAPELILKVLKTIKHLCMGEAAHMDELQRAKAIPHLVALLRYAGPEPLARGRYYAEMRNQCVNALYLLCRMSRPRQEAAAIEGALPILQEIIEQGSPLRQFALPIMCDIAKASKRALSRRYGLKRARVALSLGKGADPVKAIAPVAAEELERIFATPEPLVVALGTGRTLRAMVEEMIKSDMVIFAAVFFGYLHAFTSAMTGVFSGIKMDAPRGITVS